MDLPAKPIPVPSWPPSHGSSHPGRMCTPVRCVPGPGWKRRSLVPAPPELADSRPARGTAHGVGAQTRSESPFAQQLRARSTGARTKRLRVFFPSRTRDQGRLCAYFDANPVKCHTRCSGPGEARRLCWEGGQGAPGAWRSARHAEKLCHVTLTAPGTSRGGAGGRGSWGAFLETQGTELGSKPKPSGLQGPPCPMPLVPIWDRLVRERGEASCGEGPVIFPGGTSVSSVLLRRSAQRVCPWP